MKYLALFLLTSTMSFAQTSTTVNRTGSSCQVCKTSGSVKVCKYFKKCPIEKKRD